MFFSSLKSNQRTPWEGQGHLAVCSSTSWDSSTYQRDLGVYICTFAPSAWLFPYFLTLIYLAFFYFLTLISGKAMVFLASGNLPQNHTAYQEAATHLVRNSAYTWLHSKRTNIKQLQFPPKGSSANLRVFCTTLF